MQKHWYYPWNSGTCCYDTSFGNQGAFFFYFYCIVFLNVYKCSTQL